MLFIMREARIVVRWLIGTKQNHKTQKRNYMKPKTKSQNPKQNRKIQNPKQNHETQNRIANFNIERKSTCTDSQCGFCGYVALSNAFELHFYSYKHVFQRFTSFVEYDRRSFKNCFQQRLIFYKTLVSHQCLFKILYRWVICCNEKQ